MHRVDSLLRDDDVGAASFDVGGQALLRSGENRLQGEHEEQGDGDTGNPCERPAGAGEKLAASEWDAHRRKADAGSSRARWRAGRKAAASAIASAPAPIRMTVSGPIEIR